MIDSEKISQELKDNKKIEVCTLRFGITGDKTRLKICYLLCHYPELSVSEVAHLVGISISAASRSLSKLKKIHLVVGRRCAKEIYYSLSDNQFASLVKSQLLPSK